MAPGRKLSFESIGEEEDYMATFVPLSSLPTPPSASKQTREEKMSEDIDMEDVSMIDLAGPATHLANLVPSGVCPSGPSPTVIYTYLTRSELPLQTIALASCVLDSLSRRFPRNWREAMTEASQPPPGAQDIPSLSIASLKDLSGLTVPLPKAQLVVLAALSIASSYLDDVSSPTDYWCWLARDKFSARQINSTIRCMLIDIDYCLHTFTPDMIEEYKADMRRAGGYVSESLASVSSAVAAATEKSQKSNLSLSKSVEVNGLLTPLPSPPC
ncbi:hypothetical protein M501DRAFT_1012002 [Patellaria atrata CBS 101060]|uniref:Cyclin N-terminal domain-containing protein n=1 Tax=Patellaria atrata CBS 101060 TaxID=1346257 RepID=A0A9P4SHH5_9PEZI|nr:hypothetical protein M501DRAFT_1012002 [Patellaria atrata CBS 101060]